MHGHAATMLKKDAFYPLVQLPSHIKKESLIKSHITQWFLELFEGENLYCSDRYEKCSDSFALKYSNSNVWPGNIVSCN